MDDQSWGAAEPIRQAVHDFVSLFTKHIGPPQPTDHDKAVQQMNKDASDKAVQDANKSFQQPAQLSDDQAAKIRAKVKGK